MDILSLLNEEKRPKTGLLHFMKSFEDLQTYADNSGDIPLQQQLKVSSPYLTWV